MRYRLKLNHVVVVAVAWVTKSILLSASHTLDNPKNSGGCSDSGIARSRIPRRRS